MTLAGDDLDLFERSLRHATESCSGTALDAALDELGWRDALADDRRAAVSRLFELQGTTGATSSALDAVMASALGADGHLAVVLPPLGRTTAPSVDGHVTGLATAGIAVADQVLVATDRGVAAVAVAELVLRPISGLDPDLGLVDVTGSASTLDPIGAAAWGDAVAAGQLALAHELVGASRAMLELARAHALDRVQFDRPIAQFQAVRHKLAETLVAIEGANDAANAAWDDGSPLAAAAAKAIAGRGARLAAKHCQQVLAGIGFTLEHPFHRHLRRALVLDRLLGDSKSLTRAMGEEILRSRSLPAMLPL